ncbi:DMT family transporter [Vagococcus fessus]|uniref:QacE family quaternary ammonium compound efflux SMR transporter n=1 Tax=Vagococcus fessus TaxID=120370 RepID=A0A430AC30_9ENTE|nr:multidrug efflux SMR transporter [Vagococcus fessus]RSU04765.1 QacE family quaternary ammonium compound efflux SMR transporter [Vagococcus fessus]
MRGYIYLSGSIILEVFATTMLKFSDGFSVLLPSILLIIGYVGSFYCLSLCLKYLPLSLAYAIWTGLGTVLTAIIGIVLWHDPFNTFTLIGFALIISGVVLLNLNSEGH